jgi:adenine-specific DNA-methyltransferase
MQDLYKELIQLLEADQALIIDDKLNKGLIIDRALKLEPSLIKLLLTNPSIKKQFFVDIEDILVFDKVAFQRFVNAKNFLPDSYTQYKNKIGLSTDNDHYITDSREVVLVWPHKDCVLEGGQTKEDAKRNEIFYNTTLAPDEIDVLTAPKVLTNWKRYDKDGETIPTKISKADNLIIKGNNLLVIHSLKEKYRGQVKLIYIDPPYNTAGDKNIFSYNNTFNHSSWLTFMKNRLECAKELLKNDGFICIAIDHYELFYLGALADEIFGRENRIGIVTVLHNPKGRNQAKFFSENSEFMLVYAKNITSANFNQVAIDEEVLATFNLQDEDGKYRYENYIRARTVWSRENRPKNWYPIYVSKDLKSITSEFNEDYYELFPITAQGEFAWKNIKDSFDELNKNNYFKAELIDEKVVLTHKYYEQQVFKNVWTDKKYQSEFSGTNVLKKIIGENKFSYPKSIYTVIDTIKIMTKSNDIILDFFGGSGTTAHSILEINKSSNSKRRFILVEQLEEHIEVIDKRIKNVINQNSEGSFVYAELMQSNQNYITQIQEAKTTNELLKIWDEMQATAFISYKVLPQNINNEIKEFQALSFEEQQRFLVEILDKNLLYVNKSEINDAGQNVSEADKEMNKNFYTM